MKFYRNTRSAVLVLVLLIVPATSFSQDTIEIDTNVAVVSVSVRDNDGKHVPGLSKEDFEVFDNKQMREIEFFSRENEPVSYGIVYDLHPTTSRDIKSVLGSLESFTGRIRDADEFFLVLFNEFGSLNLNFVPTAEQVNRHLSFGERSEPNSLYDALFFAGDKLQARPLRRKTLIIISDGKDHQSHHSFSELKRLLKSFNVQVYGIVLDETDEWAFNDIYRTGDTNRIDKSSLSAASISSLSSATGGTAENTTAKSELILNGIFRRILDDINETYTIGFYPTDAEKHDLEVKLKSAELRKLKLSYRKTFEFAKEKN